MRPEPPRLLCIDNPDRDRQLKLQWLRRRSRARLRDYAGHRHSCPTVDSASREGDGRGLNHVHTTPAGAPLTDVRDMLHDSSIVQTNQYLQNRNRIRRGGERFITQY